MSKFGFRELPAIVAWSATLCIEPQTLRCFSKKLQSLNLGRALFGLFAVEEHVAKVTCLRYPRHLFGISSIESMERSAALLAERLTLSSGVPIPVWPDTLGLNGFRAVIERPRAYTNMRQVYRALGSVSLEVKEAALLTILTKGKGSEILSKPCVVASGLFSESSLSQVERLAELLYQERFIVEIAGVDGSIGDGVNGLALTVETPLCQSPDPKPIWRLDPSFFR